MLFESVAPPAFDRWRIVEADAATVAQHAQGAALVHADPPWFYKSGGVFRGLEGGNAGAIEDHYESIVDDAAISAHVAATFDAAAPDAYLFLWTTWPKLAEWMAVGAGPWRYVTGGCWHKVGRMGIGFHVRGDTEPWLLYVKGKPRPFGPLSNGYASERGAHSEKPAPYLRRVVEALTPPGALVLDVYAGRAPLGVACVEADRPYVGIELDPERATIARTNIAAAASRRR
jgi:N6-adenosine-specific RNA methylase IME4